jgi:hypothetical protein
MLTDQRALSLAEEPATFVQIRHPAVGTTLATPRFVYFPDIDLPKLAGPAGLAVGLIIASTLLISWIGGRYVPAFDRYRALTGNLRDLAE